jgi:hypothetical protein
LTIRNRHPRLPSRKPTQTLGAALVLITTCGGVLLTVILEARRQQPAYAMPVMVVVIAGLCVALIAIGGVLAMRARCVTPWLAPVVAMALVFGFLVAGTLIVAPVVVLVLLLSRYSPWTDRSARRRLSHGAAALLTLGMVPLGLLAMDRPVVECLPPGVSSSAPVWTWFGAGSVSGMTSMQSGGLSNSSSGPQRSAGSITEGGMTYFYTCAGDRLSQFTGVKSR